MNVPASVILTAIVEFLGSILALLVSAVFLRSEIDQYHLSEKFVHIYGTASAFHFLGPEFYIVYMILPMLFGLFGIVCACGLFGLREWARKGTLFLATVPVLVCVLLVLFHPNAVFPPDPGQGAILAFGGGIYLVLFEYLLVVLVPVSIWWLILFTRKSMCSQFRSQKTL